MYPDRTENVLNKSIQQITAVRLIFTLYEKWNESSTLDNSHGDSHHMLCC